MKNSIIFFLKKKIIKNSIILFYISMNYKIKKKISEIENKINIWLFLYFNRTMSILILLHMINITLVSILEMSTYIISFLSDFNLIQPMTIETNNFKSINNDLVDNKDLIVNKMNRGLISDIKRDIDIVHSDMRSSDNPFNVLIQRIKLPLKDQDIVNLGSERGFFFYARNYIHNVRVDSRETFFSLFDFKMIEKHNFKDVLEYQLKLNKEIFLHVNHFNHNLVNQIAFNPFLNTTCVNSEEFINELILISKNNDLQIKDLHQILSDLNQTESFILNEKHLENAFYKSSLIENNYLVDGEIVKAEEKDVYNNSTSERLNKNINRCLRNKTQIKMKRTQLHKGYQINTTNSCNEKLRNDISRDNFYLLNEKKCGRS